MCSKEYIIQRKKYNVPEQRIIGKRSENNPDRMLPNETFVKYFGGQEMPEQKAGQTRSSCLRIGTFLVIQKILNGYKLPEILEKYLGKKETGCFWIWQLILLSVKIMPHSIILPMLTAIRFLQSRCIYTVIQKCQIFLQDLQMIRG